MQHQGSMHHQGAGSATETDAQMREAAADAASASFAAAAAALDTAAPLPAMLTDHAGESLPDATSVAAPMAMACSQITRHSLCLPASPAATARNRTSCRQEGISSGSKLCSSSDISGIVPLELSESPPLLGFAEIQLLLLPHLPSSPPAPFSL